MPPPMTGIVELVRSRARWVSSTSSFEGREDVSSSCDRPHALIGRERAGQHRPRERGRCRRRLLTSSARPVAQDGDLRRWYDGGERGHPQGSDVGAGVKVGPLSSSGRRPFPRARSEQAAPGSPAQQRPRSRRCSSRYRRGEISRSSRPMGHPDVDGETEESSPSPPLSSDGGVGTPESRPPQGGGDTVHRQGRRRRPPDAPAPARVE